MTTTLEPLEKIMIYFNALRDYEYVVSIQNQKFPVDFSMYMKQEECKTKITIQKGRYTYFINGNDNNIELHVITSIANQVLHFQQWEHLCAVISCLMLNETIRPINNPFFTFIIFDTLVEILSDILFNDRENDIDINDVVQSVHNFIHSFYMEMKAEFQIRKNYLP